MTRDTRDPETLGKTILGLSATGVPILQAADVVAGHPNPQTQTGTTRAPVPTPGPSPQTAAQNGSQGRNDALR